MGTEILLFILCIILLVSFLIERNKRQAYSKHLDVENYTLEETTMLMDAVFKNVHAFIILIDDDFAVLKTNYYMLTGTIATLEKKRVGDLLHCRNAMCALHGCGTGELCKTCPIRHAIQNALDTKSNFNNLEATLDVMTDEANSTRIDALISGSYFVFAGKVRMVLTVHDVTGLKKEK